jgi:ribonuclease BN (tRNA processing enzyme)
VRLTVVGSGTSQPQAETPASGLLIETETTALLVDCGQGIIRELLTIRDPRELDAIVIGHMHADHYIDLVSLRYLLPWEGVAGEHLPLLLPPGGKARIDALATAISERPHFFDDAYSVLEYDPAHRLHVGDLTVEFVAGQHYVPAWGCIVRDAGGATIAITGDTGPNESFAAIARGADLYIAEATLISAEFDDPRRGHLTPEEALEMADQARCAGSGARPFPRRAAGPDRRRMRPPSRRPGRPARAADRGRPWPIGDRGIGPSQRPAVGAGAAALDG